MNILYIGNPVPHMRTSRFVWSVFISFFFHTVYIFHSMGNFRWLYQIQEHLGIHQWGVLLLCVLYWYIYVYLRDEIAYLCILELIIIHTRLFGASEKLRDKQIRRATNWRIEKNRDRINWINCRKQQLNYGKLSTVENGSLTMFTSNEMRCVLSFA